MLHSSAQEAAFVAHRLREAHLLRGVPWHRMAVVVRGAARQSTLRRVLAARGVPVLGDAHRVPVRDEPSARPLLHLLGICVELARGQLESVPAADVVDLLASPLVAADTVNTMPGKTMDAFADHGWVNTESIIGLAAESQEIFDKLSEDVPLYPIFHRKAPTAYDSTTLENFKPIALTGLSFVGTGSTKS